MECMLVFESRNELVAFKDYVAQIWHRREGYSNNIWTLHFPEIEGYTMEAFKEKYDNVQILQRMPVEYRENAI